MLGPDATWLAQRRWPDLDARAEQALREAGLAFSHAERAEQCLTRAALIAPEHEAVLIAHYRYNLYKHRFAEAAHYSWCYLRLAAARVDLPDDPLRVRASDIAGCAADEASLRAWLFACQAHGYVLMRAGQRAEGEALLDHLMAVDVHDQSRTAALCAVMRKAEQPDD